MKFVPVTVTVLPAYAAAGPIFVAVGLNNMLSGVDGTVATLAPFVNVNSTDDAVPGLLLAVVLVSITTTTVVALAYVHVAEVPLPGAAPTFAVHLQHESKVRNLQRLPRNTWQAAIIALLQQVSGSHMQ